MNTLLYLGGGLADRPMISAATALGFRVVTTGNRPDDPGHELADAYVNADFSSPEAMIAVARRENATAVCASCNDFAAISAAHVAHALELPGHDSLDTTLRIHHKDRFRDLLAELELPTPRAFTLGQDSDPAEARERLRLPILVKPVDLTGGKGITRVESWDSLSSAVNEARSNSRLAQLVLEEFIDGSRHGMTCMLRNQEIAFSFHDDEQYFRNPFLVSGASSPGRSSEACREELIAASERIARELELVDGIFHIQYIQSSGTPYIIEICRRPPGDLYVELVSRSAGIDYAKWIVNAASGRGTSEVHQPTHTTPYLRHCVMADGNGRVRSIDIHPEFEACLAKAHALGGPGDVVSDYMKDKLGILFFAFDSASMMHELLDNIDPVTVGIER